VSPRDSAIKDLKTSALMRLGFSLLRGMREDTAGRIEPARAVRPFVDVADLARRAQLDRHDLQVLARANALRLLAGSNRLRCCTSAWRATTSSRRTNWLRCAVGSSLAACGLVTVQPAPGHGQRRAVHDTRGRNQPGQRDPVARGLLEKFRKEALGAALLAVYGLWQAEGMVRHLIASKLVDRSELLGALPTTAREFC